MTALVVGASGLVGRAILRALGEKGVGTYLTRPRPGLRQLDARDALAFGKLLDEVKADTIYFPAAQPNVEWIEAHPDEGRALNLDPLRGALEAAGGRRIVAFSTDYVFDGRDGPYHETDAVAPLSVYGRVKLELEELLVAGGHLALRTTGVFGVEDGPPKNFVLRLIASLRAGERLRVPSDQIANPTYAPDLATAAIRLASGAEAGIWHVAGPELLARSDFARLVARAFALPETLIDAVPTADLGQVARRPLRSGLSCDKYMVRYGPPGRPLRAALGDLRQELAT